MIRNSAAAAALSLFAVSASVHTGAQSPAAAQAIPTYSRDIAPILYRNCTTCHRPGEIGPMSLLTYKDARPWAKSINARVEAGTMPPWHADPSIGEFENDRRLSPADKDTLARWVAGGAPEGDPADLPAPPHYTDGWIIGQPDAVLTMQEDYAIPASGTIAYQYFEVPTNFAEDRWIQAFEVRPGNRSVVHHVIVYTRPPARPAPAPAAQSGPRPVALFEFAKGMEIPPGQTGGGPLPPGERKAPGLNDRPAPRTLGPSIGAYVPGTSTRSFPAGTAARLAAGSTLVFQMHYTTTGKETTDRTSIGFIFSKTPPQTELRFTALLNGSLHIPAGDPDYRVDAEMTINRDVTLWGMLPHTHVRGKQWSYDVTFPDGRKEAILAVPKYDFDWQTDYIFKHPMKLPKGTTLHATAWYDNSARNKSNPNPGADVWWGDQTWEEMMFTGLTYSVDSAPPTASGGAQ
jgi:hypothetical protein